MNPNCGLLNDHKIWCMKMNPILGLNYNFGEKVDIRFWFLIIDDIE